MVYKTGLSGEGKEGVKCDCGEEHVHDDHRFAMGMNMVSHL
jgi:hypothetical protein